MTDTDDPLAILWDSLLSRDLPRVRRAFFKLTPTDQAAVRDHLHRMVSEPDWLPEQRLSAQKALEALSRLTD